MTTHRYLWFGLLVSAVTCGLQVSEAATYYVATNGSDSYTCTQAQSQSTPKRTINNGRTCLKAGDTLSIMPGTYAESLQNPLPSGLSATQPTTLTGFSATNRPVLRPTSGSNTYIILLNSARSNIRFKNFVIDARSYTGTLNNAFATNNDTQITGLTIQDCEAIGRGGIGRTGSGINIGTNTVATVRRCSVHGWDSGGDPGAHGFYWKGSNGLVEDNEIYDNNGWGIQFYCSCGTVNNNTFRNNLVHGSGTHGSLYMGSGSGNLAYNNLLVDSVGPAIHVRGTGTKIFNNTIVGNGRAMHIGASRAEIRNNIIYGNSQGIVNQSTNTAFSNNLCGTAGTGCQFVGDPRFVNRAAGDYHLRSGSPAIDRGQTLSQVPRDYDDVLRPQGAAYDIGAYEFH